MNMGKDPAVLFYTSDFLSGTYTMTNEQVGKYIRLLCLQHQKKRLTIEDMLSVCVKKDPIIFAKFKEDKIGFYNERMDEEIQRRISYSKSRSNNRKKKKDMIKTSSTYVNHMETENETESITINEDNKNGDFENFWNLYDKKIDRAKCLPKWNRLTEADRVSIMEILPTYLKANPEIKYRKNPATFLNNRSWEDVEGMNQQIKSEKPKEESFKMPGNYLKGNHFNERQSNSNDSEPKKLSELIKK